MHKKTIFDERKFIATPRGRGRPIGPAASPRPGSGRATHTPAVLLPHLRHLLPLLWLQKCRWPPLAVAVVVGPPPLLPPLLATGHSIQRRQLVVEVAAVQLLLFLFVLLVKNERKKFEI